MQQTYDQIINELKRMKRTANDIAKGVEKMEEKVTGVPAAKEKEPHSHDSEAVISFASYELQMERAEYERENLMDRFEKEKTDMRNRFDKEKEEMRNQFERDSDKKCKHYRRIIAWISSIMVAFILGFFVTAIWFFSTYEFASYSQDGDGINNYAIETEQGDLNYGPNNPDDKA